VRIDDLGCSLVKTGQRSGEKCIFGNHHIEVERGRKFPKEVSSEESYQSSMR